MKRKINLILALFISITLLSQSKRVNNLGDFNVLKVYNGIEVQLIKSNEAKLEITGEKSEIVKIKNVNNTLKLSLPFSLKPLNNYANGKVLIKIYYKNKIDVIDANQGSIITGKEFQQEEVEIRTQERAYINLVLKSKNITVRSTSGGIVKLSGSASSQDVFVDLYGVYHGFGLIIENSSMIKAGTGAKAEVFAGKTLTAKVTFGGSIFYKGSPELIRDKKIVGGIIQKKD
tara:strand:+ start:414 stop:1106 length:693 start_codon:yes stop_codon:yes gene_type:complete